MKPAVPSLPRPWRALALLAALLAGCGDHQADEDHAPADKGIVTVTTIAPRQQRFHDTVLAWGSATADPQRARALSLGHGGQLEALDVSPGERVERGQPLLTIAPDPAARRAWRQALDARDLARGELKRTQAMADEHLATQAQLAVAGNALAEAQAALDEQRALGGSQAEETLKAPVDGVVSTIAVTRGERFTANAPLLTFSPAHALVAELGVQPGDGDRLKAGMTVSLNRVYGTGDPLDGRLAMIGAAVDPRTHLLPARVTLPADAGTPLVAGDPLRASIQTHEFQAWAVPRDAVLHDDHGDYLFQLDHGKAKRIDVTLRSAQGDPVGVDGPLDPQARVIVQGVYELADGDRVREAAK
jgi:RND family efflux transporter MFP subunit